MRYLVTGGCGFIGKNLCDRLLKEGHDVVVVDNLISGSNTAGLEEGQFCSLNIGQLSFLLLPKLDGIFNLACPASPVFYKNYPMATINACTTGLMEVLKVAKRNKCPVVHTSTSEVYGDPTESPQRESYRGNVATMGPRACYDEGKRMAETICYLHKDEVDIRLARLFNTYGPWMRQDDGRVVSNFIYQALRKETMTVYGDGSQTRSFCYVDDTVEALVRMMNSTKIKSCDPINIGNPHEITIKHLALEVSVRINKPTFINQMPNPDEHDPIRRKPDIEKAKRLLNWAPKVSLKDGMDKTIDYFKERI